MFLVVYTREQRQVRNPVVYDESLELVAAEVNGTQMTLRDVAFYVAYEEAEVEEKAVIYDREHPEKYWNARVEGGFTRIVARNAAIQMAIHDEIFYQMAQADEIALTEEEEENLQSILEDFWSDLTDRKGEQSLGVSREEMESALRKIAYAQKYQEIYAQLQGKAYEDYDFTAEEYARLLEQQDYTIHDKVWRRVKFGSVTLGH